MRARGEMKVRFSHVLDQAIETASNHAVRRAFKHRDDHPCDEAVEALKQAFRDEMWIALDEWFTFDE